MKNPESLDKLHRARLDERQLQFEDRRFEAENELRLREQKLQENAENARNSQAQFDRRYRLLELRERRADRELKRRELDANQGREIKFTSAQATVAAATLALASALLGAVIQGIV